MTPDIIINAVLGALAKKNPDKNLAEAVKEYNKTKKITDVILGKLGKAKISSKTLFEVASLYCDNEPNEGNRKIKSEMLSMQGQMKLIQSDFKESEEAFADFKNTWEEIQTAAEEVLVLKSMGKDSNVQAFAFDELINPLKETKIKLVGERDAYFKKCQAKIADFKTKLAALQAKLDDNKKAFDDAIKQLNVFDFGESGSKTRERRFELAVTRSMKGAGLANSTAQCILSFMLDDKGYWVYKANEVLKQEVMFKAFNITPKIEPKTEKSFLLILNCMVAMNTVDIDKSNSSQTSHSTDVFDSKKQADYKSTTGDRYTYTKKDEEQFKLDLQSKKSQYKAEAKTWFLGIGVSANVKGMLDANLNAELQAGVDLAIDGVDKILEIVSAIKDFKSPPAEKEDKPSGKTDDKQDASAKKQGFMGGGDIDKPSEEQQSWLKKVWDKLTWCADKWDAIPDWVLSIAEKLPYVGPAVKIIDFIMSLVKKANGLFGEVKDIVEKDEIKSLKSQNTPKNLDNTSPSSPEVKIKLDISAKVAARVGLNVELGGDASLTLSAGSNSNSAEISNEKTNIDLKSKENVDVNINRDINTDTKSNSSQHDKREQNSASHQSSFSSSEHGVDAVMEFKYCLLCSTTDEGKLKIKEEGSVLGAIEKGISLGGNDLKYVFVFNRTALDSEG